MPRYTCQRAGCAYRTEDVEAPMAAIFMQDHLNVKHPQAAKP